MPIFVHELNTVNLQFAVKLEHIFTVHPTRFGASDLKGLFHDPRATEIDNGYASHGFLDSLDLHLKRKNPAESDAWANPTY